MEKRCQRVTHSPTPTKFNITKINIFSVICGLTESTRPEHLIRATLEAVCYQTRDILESMSLDCGFPLSKLLVDGGMTANNLLMQLQADLCGIPVGNYTKNHILVIKLYDNLIFSKAFNV